MTRERCREIPFRLWISVANFHAEDTSREAGDGATAWLDHPEHGNTGIGPGRYVLRRKRELAPRALEPGADRRRALARKQARKRAAREEADRAQAARERAMNAIRFVAD